MFDVPTPTLSALVEFLRTAQESWTIFRTGRTGNIGSVVVSVDPTDWATLAVEAETQGIDPYVDASVEDDELIFHMPVAKSWKSYVRVFVLRRSDFPAGLWVIDLDESEPWPPDLLRHYETELVEWEWYWSEREEYTAEFDAYKAALEAGASGASQAWTPEEPVEPQVPAVPLPMHIYRLADPSELAWVEGPTEDQVHLRRGKRLDYLITRRWIELVLARVSPADAKLLVQDPSAGNGKGAASP